MSGRWLTQDEKEIVFSDWEKKHDDAVARLAKLEHFEATLFERLNDDLPEDNRERITDEDGGLLEHVQREIRSLIRSIPYYRRNVELTATRRANARALAQMIDQVFIPAQVRKWAEESSCTAEVNG